VDMAKMEKAGFDRGMVDQAKAHEKELERALTRERDNAIYRQDLKDEIRQKTIERQMQPIVNLDEQKHMEELNEDYIMKVERIRQMQLHVL
jgi:hypothetical protein